MHEIDAIDIHFYMDLFDEAEPEAYIDELM
jgi:hypothetical protein